MKFSPKQAMFVRIFKRHFSAPRDWTPEAISRGTSSALDWLEFVEDNRTSMDLVENVLKELREEIRRGDRPTFSQFRRSYLQKAGRWNSRRLDTPPGEECAYCWNSGYVHALFVVESGKEYGVYTKTQHRGSQGAYSRPVPCLCSRGQIFQERYRADPCREAWEAGAVWRIDPKQLAGSDPWTDPSRIVRTQEDEGL